MHLFDILTKYECNVIEKKQLQWTKNIFFSSFFVVSFRWKKKCAHCESVLWSIGYGCVSTRKCLLRVCMWIHFSAHNSSYIGRSRSIFNYFSFQQISLPHRRFDELLFGTRQKCSTFYRVFMPHCYIFKRDTIITFEQIFLFAIFSLPRCATLIRLHCRSKSIFNKNQLDR